VRVDGPERITCDDGVNSMLQFQFGSGDNETKRCQNINQRQ
jgi:hypothetical protein